MASFCSATVTAGLDGDATQLVDAAANLGPGFFAMAFAFLAGTVLPEATRFAEPIADKEGAVGDAAEGFLPCV
jgi:hypothetical protein